MKDIGIGYLDICQKNLAKDLGLLIDELGNEPSKNQRALSAVRARQYFDIIFYWLEGVY